MKLVTEIKIKPNYTQNDLKNAICNKISIKYNELLKYETIKMGIDARKKPNIFYVVNVAIDVSSNVQHKLKKYLDFFPDHRGLEYEKRNNVNKNPVVVGFGPSGMFCALVLALKGYNPIVIEQGKCVEERQKDVENFWYNRILNEHSNVQFGEGGAGTFSDGKLNTTLNNEYCKKVINELILNGAPKEIYYKNKAHIGTDNLKLIVKNIREKIIKLGGKVIFNAKFLNFEAKNNQIEAICYKNLINDEIINVKTNSLILAVGHSAINVFEMLKDNNIKMRQKPFAMGVRIEHKQSLINYAQYGDENPQGLPSADYKIVEHLPNGRSVFSFCMCPGGQVVASSSEKGTVVTNGMSEFARNKKYANSALLVNVTPEDFKSDNVLEGLYFQREYEKKAFELAGSNYNAPCETVGSFLNDKTNKNMSNCSYLPNISMCKIQDCLPNFVTESLKYALPLFDKKIKGFANDDILLIAPETRSSCPIQFIRDEKYTCTVDGLYACGEGAGYAGGIISSAVDGVKCAENIN